MSSIFDKSSNTPDKDFNKVSYLRFFFQIVFDGHLHNHTQTSDQKGKEN